MQWSLILLFLMAQCCFMDERDSHCPLLPSSETTAKGTGLAESAGNEDPVELDLDCQLYEFHYINENKNWTEAQQYCREKHTDLVTVTNMKDMKRLINISAGDQSEAWIGLYNQTRGTRTWFWSLPGVEFNESETNWEANEPNDGENPVTHENCVIVNKDVKWIDTVCLNKYNFLCYDETNKTNKYNLIREQKTWQEAQSYCRENHTDLISGTKQLQDEDVKKLMNSNDLIYTGLFRDTWMWSDGNSFSFRHWNNNFNDQQINSDQCATTVFNDGGRWKNENCAERKPFICYDDKFILIKEKMNWEEALYYCRDHHHDLVSITNMDDQMWVQEKTKNASTSYVWMGLRYTCTLDFWFWVSDQVVFYTNWASDGPMDDCDMSGAMETGGEHKWRKKNDLEEFNFICSKQ